MSWTQGTNQAFDRVGWAVATEYHTDNSMAPYALGTRYHIALRVQQQTSTSSLVDWYAAPATDAVITAKSGSMTVPFTLANLVDTTLALGSSQYGDNVATASYDEVRFWNSAVPIAVLNALQVAGPDSIIGGDSGHLPTATAVILSGTGNLDVTGAVQTIGSLSGTGTTSVTLTDGALTMGDGTSTSFSGTLTGSGSLTKVGSGTQTLAGTNAYTGATTVSAGTLLVSGSTASGSAVSVANGATLGGTGPVAGTVALAAGSTLAPGLGGTAIGTLTTGSVTCNATSIVSLDLDGTAPTNDRVTTSGTVACAGTLTVASIANAALAKVYTIVSAGTVSGTFSGLVNGAKFTQQGRTFQIAYTGTTVTLTDVARPTTRVWDGGGADNNWTTAANWDFDLAPVAGDDLQFAGSTRPSPNNDFTAATSFASITFNSGATAFTLGGNAITLAGAVTNSSTALQTVNLALAVVATRTVDAASGNLALGGVVSGAGGLTKAGGNVLTLSGTNTYIGATTVAVGSLQLGNASALGSTAGGTSVASGATLDLNGQTLGAEALSLTGSGVGALGALINSGGSASYAGNITLANPCYVGGSGDMTLSGAVTSATLIKIGTHTLTLSGTSDNNSMSLTANEGTVVLAKTSTGGVHSVGGIGITVGGGTVKLGGSGGDQIYDNVPVLLTTGTFDVAGNSETFTALRGSGGTVDNTAGVGTYTLTLTGTGTYSAAATIQNTSGTLALTINGAGAVHTFSGTNTYSGTTTITAGTLKLGSVTALGAVGGATTVASGAVLDLNGMSYAASEALTLNGTGISSGGALINSSSTGATFTGPITLGSATSILGGTGTITLNSGSAIGGSGLALTLGGAAGGTLTSVLGTGTGTLTKQDAGTWTLAGTNTYTGATTVSAGTFLVSGSTAASSALSVSNGATLGGSGTVSGTVALAAGSTLAPGLGGTAIGTLTTGSVTCNATSILSLDLNGTTPTNDRVTSTGTVACAGTLTVASIANAAVGKVYTIASGTSVTGTFAGLANGALSAQAGRLFRIAYTTSVTLTDCAPVLLSRQTLDTDGNGRIDRIRLTFDLPLNDVTSGLTVTVAGYGVIGYSTGTANDAVLDVLLAEGGSADTGATPAVRITANTTLAHSSGNGLVPVEGSGTAATDAAAPVLMAATWTDGGTGGVSAGDTVTLTFSESVTATAMTVADLGLPVTSDTLSSTTIANQAGSTVTMTLAGSPRLTPGGAYNAAAIVAGKSSGVFMVSGAHVQDAVGLTAATGTASSAVDLAPGTTTVAIAWATGGDPRTWALGALSVGSIANSLDSGIDLTVRDTGNCNVDLSIASAATAPSNWSPAASAGANAYLMKAGTSAAANGARTTPASYALTLTSSAQGLTSGLLSGTTSAYALYFQAPTSITSGSATPQTIVITISAALAP